MKKLITYILLILSTTSLSAQMTIDDVTVKEINSSTLPPFTAIDINAPMDIFIVGVPTPEECRIEYDLKGVTDSKFEFSVKDSVLYIRERVSLKRTSTSEAVVYFHSMNNITALRANINIDTPIISDLIDIKLHSEASLTATIECRDVKLNVSGRSLARLEGNSEYVSISASSSATAVVQGIDCRAAWVDASHGATVGVRAHDRMEIKSVVGAVVRYFGEPSIIRTERSMIGGEILQIKDE